MDNFERIQRLRDDYESALDEAEKIRDEYHREVVKLHRSGMSLREIADGLGISHQRVHQIVAPHEAETPASPKRKRAIIAGGGVAVLALLLVAGLQLVHRHESVSIAPAAMKVAPLPPPLAGPVCAPSGETPPAACAKAALVQPGSAGLSLRPGPQICGPAAFGYEEVNPTKTRDNHVEICRGVVEIDPKTGKVLGHSLVPIGSLGG